MRAKFFQACLLGLLAGPAWAEAPPAVAELEVGNPSAFARPDTLVRLSLESLGTTEGPFQVWEGETARPTQLIDEDGVKGVTSNPSIFEKAIGSSDEYDGAIGKALHHGDQPVRTGQVGHQPGGAHRLHGGAKAGCQVGYPDRPEGGIAERSESTARLARQDIAPGFVRITFSHAF